MSCKAGLPTTSTCVAEEGHVYIHLCRATPRLWVSFLSLVTQRSTRLPTYVVFRFRVAQEQNSFPLLACLCPCGFILYDTPSRLTIDPAVQCFYTSNWLVTSRFEDETDPAGETHAEAIPQACCSYGTSLAAIANPIVDHLDLFTPRLVSNPPERRPHFDISPQSSSTAKKRNQPSCRLPQTS